jgi:hypothetical protein
VDAPKDNPAQPPVPSTAPALDAVRAEGHDAGQRGALRLGILDLCESFGVSLSPERLAEIDAMAVPQLDELRLALKRDRRWPGTPAPRRNRFALSQRSRRIGLIGMVGSMGGIVLVSFVPAVIATAGAKTFCSSVAVGTPLSELEERAERDGYTVTELKNQRWVFEHPWSLGRATCVVRVDEEQRVKSAAAGQ